MRDEDIAKLMDGVYKSGVLGPEATPANEPRIRLGCSPPRRAEMSALGHKLTSASRSGMSAFPPEADFAVRVQRLLCAISGYERSVAPMF
jgi:hypothetical protein